MNDYDAERMEELQARVSDLEEERDCERERAGEAEGEVRRLQDKLADRELALAGFSGLVRGLRDALDDFVPAGAHGGSDSDKNKPTKT